ncbi:MAG: hypothetical protein RDV48_12535 [Candidatus Eremiobacteraeota bacterium]|nr:hypothetical protein [Candidatus Eremiobacteraeota bacterium]
MDPLKSSASYSTEGKALSETALKALAGKRDNAGKLELFNDCFEKIGHSPVTTPDEKALAAFGKSICPVGAPSSEGMEARALEAVVESMTLAGAGTPGSIIACAALKAQDAVGGGLFSTGKARWAFRDEMLDKAFLAVQGSTRTSSDEKDIAKFGMDIAYKDSYSRTMAKARQVVLSAIAQPSSGPIAAVIAETALKAQREGDSFEAASILYRGFEAVASNKRVPAEVREFAEKGKNAYDCPGIPDPIDEKEAFLPVMKELPGAALKGEEAEARRKEAETRESLVELAEEALQERPAGLTVEEEFIDIAGIRLGRQQR